MDKMRITSLATFALFSVSMASPAWAASGIQEKDLGGSVNTSPSTKTPNTPQIEPLPVTALSNPEATQAQGFDYSEAPANAAKGDFSDGFKSVGRGFKNGTHATGHAFKKVGATMGHGFKKAGSGLKWFFTGQWINKKSSEQGQTTAMTANPEALPVQAPVVAPAPASDLDSVGNTAPKATAKDLVKSDLETDSQMN